MFSFLQGPDRMPSLMQASSQGSLTPIATFKLLKGCCSLREPGFAMGGSRDRNGPLSVAGHPALESPHPSAACGHAPRRRCNPHSLLMMGLISLTYATLLFVEGFGPVDRGVVGCLPDRLSMSVLLPSELHAVAHEVSVTGLVIVAANVAIVGYLLYRLGNADLAIGDSTGRRAIAPPLP